MNASPFKFLDPYKKEDGQSFFGRAREVEQLYQQIDQTDLLLLYGSSGTGKTSLVQSGLAARMNDTDWLPIYIRRGENMMESLHGALRETAKTPIPEVTPLPQAAESLFLDYFKPVYLIFDQFEELIILGNRQEREVFTASIQTLLKAKVRCKVMLIIREEYLATLNEMENTLPDLFNNRMRVEPMSYLNTQQMIESTCTAFGIQLDPREEVLDLIIEQTTQGRSAIDLSYLQIYLDRLYRKAMEDAEDKPVTFSPDLIYSQGGLEDVMHAFLEESTRDIEKELHERYPSIAPLIDAILQEFITEEGTKRGMQVEKVALNLNAPKEVVHFCLQALEERRILRRYEDDELELTNSSLANIIYQRMSAEEKALRNVERSIRNASQLYQEGMGSLLSQNQLESLEPNLSKLRLPPEEQAFIAHSRERSRQEQEAKYRKEHRRNLLRNTLLLFFIVLSIILAILLAIRS